MAVQVNKIYRLGDFSLDHEKRGLTRGDKEVRLASRPFKVLLYLIEHRERLVTRAELLELFWQGQDVYDETLTKCVGAIRKALDDRLEHPRFIETRYSEGYRFIGPLEEQVISSAPAIIEYERTRGLKIIVEEEEIHDSEPAKEQAQPVPTPTATLSLSAPKSARRIMTLTLIAVVLTVSALVAYRIRAHNTVDAQASRPAPLPLTSIAVLPLRNLSGDPAQDYFSDGLTESFITELARSKGLKVISRGSVFAFKGKETDPREVGRRLNVAAILEGSVYKSGERVRVEVRLVSTEDGRVLWASDTYDRTLGDIFIIEDEITRGVAAGLTPKLNGAVAPAAAKRFTNNREAYEAYLKGRYHWNRRTDADLLQAIAQFQLAIARDPQYALAYAGLAETYAVQEANAIVPPRTAAPKAEASATKALELDDTLSGAYAVLGLMKSFSDWNWSEGERMFQQALARDPGYATAHHWYANSLLARGRFEQAEAELQRAQELDPLSLPIANSLGETYYYARQNDRCIAQAKVMLELDPHNGYAPRLLSRAYKQKGMYQEAEAALPQQGDIAYDRALIYAAAGRREEARKLTDEVRQSAVATNSPSAIAVLYAALGDKQAAFAWLEQAYNTHQSDLVSIKVDPAFDPLRSDPRFADLLKRVGLSE